jgi:uncharacterized membrane protein YuzA (DUF378 family)
MEVFIMAGKNSLEMIAKILVIVGGLNWGLVALGYNVVTLALGSIPILVTVVYALVALSALYLLVDMVKK